MHVTVDDVNFCNCPRMRICKVTKGAKNRNRYKQVPHLTKDTNGKLTKSQLDTKNESQEVSPFSAGDHNAHINRSTQRTKVVHQQHPNGLINTCVCDG